MESSFEFNLNQFKNKNNSKITRMNKISYADNLKLDIKHDIGLQ